MKWNWFFVITIIMFVGIDLSILIDPFRIEGIGALIDDSMSPYEIHSTIRIDNSSHLAEMVLLEGWDGNGTKEDPYIISGLEIDGNRSSYCIHIRYTQEHLIIEDCKLFNGSLGYYNRYSLVMDYCRNITVRNCEIDNMDFLDTDKLIISNISWTADERSNIDLQYCDIVHLSNIEMRNDTSQIAYCGNIVIEDCLIEGPNVLLSMIGGSWDGGDSIIRNCRFKDTYGGGNPEGIRISNNPNLHLYDNLFMNSFPYVNFYGNPSFLETISIPPNNTVNSNPIISVIYKDLEWGEVPDGGSYYMFLYSKNITIKDVTLPMDSVGFSALACTGILFDGVSIPSDSLLGIFTDQTDMISINDTTISNDGDGLRMDQVMEFSISNSSFFSCDRGLVLNYAYMSEIYPSEISDTEFINCDLGIRVNDFDSVKLHNCRFKNSGTGMEIERSYGWRIFENSFHGSNGSAISMLRGSLENWVYWNIFGENNIFNGTQRPQVEDTSDLTRWYNPDLEEGNWWSEHRGPDLDRDGIVDDPYLIDEWKITDQKPLVSFPKTSLRAPEGFEISVENAKVKIRWEPPSVENAPVVHGYHIYRTMTGNGSLTRIDVEPDRWTYTDNFVVFGEEYTYWMTAFNLREESEGSEVLTTYVYDRPGIVVNLTYICNRTSINLSWDPPGSDGGSPIIGYNIHRSLSPIAWTMIGMSDHPWYQDDDIEIGQIYYYFISARNIVGEGDLSVSFMVKAYSTPDPPTAKVDSTGDDYISISWSEPSYTGGTVLVSYKIYRGSDNDTLVYLETVDPSIYSYNDSGLSEGLTYYYAVSSVNSKGESIISRVLNVTVGMIRPDLPRPRSLSGDPGNGNVVLSFQPPELLDDLVLLHYHVYRREMGYEFVLISTTVSIRYRDDTVINGITYQYRVTAVYANGESGPTPSVTVIPEAGISPFGLPRDLWVSAGNGHVILRWLEPADNRNGSILRYNIYSGASSNISEIVGSVDGSQRSVTINDLENDVTYRFYLSAVYFQGESDLAGPVEATPQGSHPPPGVPIGFNAILNETGVLLTWTPPPGSVSGFRIYRSEGGEGSRVMITEILEEYVTYLDLNISEGSSYRYSVSAFNDNGEGPRTMDVLITIPISEVEEPDVEQSLDSWIYIAVGASILLFLILLIFLLARRDLKEEPLEE